VLTLCYYSRIAIQGVRRVAKMQIDPHSEAATPHKDRFLSLAEVASMLQIYNPTVRRRMEDGTIPGLKIGGRWGCPESILKRWMRGEGGAMSGRAFLRQNLEANSARELPDNLEGRFVLFMEGNSWCAVHEAASETVSVQGRGETPAGAISALLHNSYIQRLIDRNRRLIKRDATD
jgi:excisionase family DNA binding protein